MTTTLIIHFPDGMPEARTIAIEWASRIPTGCNLCGFRSNGFEGYVKRIKSGLSVTVRLDALCARG